MPKAQHRSWGTWFFGTFLFIFFVGVFVFAPDKLPDFKQRMLAISCALLSGLLGYFLTGDLGIEIRSIKSRFGDVGVKATGGLALFVLVLGWWISPLAPIQTEEIGIELGEIKHLLEQEFRKQLGEKDMQIAFLQGQVLQLQAIKPSIQAQDLARHIPDNADPYTLALKAMAESRFDDARELLVRAQESKEVELSKIYEARGHTEEYAARYSEALGWYQKALALRPDDLSLMNQVAGALYNSGREEEAMPLCERVLAIREKTLAEDDPKLAQSLNNLALVYYSQKRFEEAEHLFQRGLPILEKAYGKEDLKVAMTLENMGNLYYTQVRYDEAEPFFQRTLAIREKAFGEDDPRLADSLMNLVVAICAQGRFDEAEPLLQRGIALLVKELGKDHPKVNTAVIFYARVLRYLGRSAEEAKLKEQYHFLP